MARASVTTQVIGPAGGDLTMGTPAVSPNGDIVDLGSRNFLVVRNGSGAPITVTIDTTSTLAGLALPDRTVTVAAGAINIIPLSDDYYEQLSGSDIRRGYVDYSAITTVTRAVVRFS